MRVLFIGSGDIGLPTLEWLLRNEEVVGVVAQPDKPVGRKQILTPPPTKRLALEHGVSVFQPKRLRAPEAVAELEPLKPDLIVVIAYGQILPKAILEMPRLACLNLHASLLPKYRGAAPIQAALEAGERETGMAVMWMDEGLDTGDVLLEKRVLIRRRETGGSLHDRLALLAPEALAEALVLLREGRAPRIPQNHAEATYAAKLSRESGVVDWSATSEAIDRKIRAMNPWPSAATTVQVHGKWLNLKLFSLIIHRRSGEKGAPGEILRADKRGLLVATGNGALLLREVQLEGKKRMSAGDFLLGTPVPVGSFLGGGRE